jgi:uncharacterized membrane protein YfcA
VIWLEFALVGLVAGFSAGYLGIGGGLVLVPALTWIFLGDAATRDLAVHLAVATSLATMLLTSLSSIVAHQRRGGIDWQVVRHLAPGLLIGAVLGAFLADRLSTPALGRVFGAYAMLAGLQLLLGAEARGRRPLPGPAGSTAVGGVFGAISSLVGIGGGSLTVPWFLWHGMRAQRAVATAAACGYPIAVAGTATFVGVGLGAATPGEALGYVHLPAFAGIVVVSVLAAPVGAAAVHRSPPRLVRKAFGAVLIAVAIRMWV